MTGFEDITSLGAGAVIAIIIIREFINLQKIKKNQNGDDIKKKSRIFTHGMTLGIVTDVGSGTCR